MCVSLMCACVSAESCAYVYCFYRGYQLDRTNNLKIPNVQSIHTGEYICVVNSNFCLDLSLHRSAFLRFIGKYRSAVCL